MLSAILIFSQLHFWSSPFTHYLLAPSPITAACLLTETSYGSFTTFTLARPCTDQRGWAFTLVIGPFPIWNLKMTLSLCVLQSPVYLKNVEFLLLSSSSWHNACVLKIMTWTWKYAFVIKLSEIKMKTVTILNLHIHGSHSMW